MATFGATTTNANPNRSTEVVSPPSDSVSSLCFSPKANFLVATSWDNQVRCWEVQKSGTTVITVPKASISHDQPVLCSAWKDDGTTVFSGGCDKQVKMWPLLSGGQPVTVAMHDAPVKELAWIPEMNLLVTGSWDKTLRYWDLRQQNPTWVQQLPERCYALTVRHPLMVVGTADRNLIVFNLQNPQSEFKRVVSPLKYQTRCLAAFPDQQGFLVGSIEGRVGLKEGRRKFEVVGGIKVFTTYVSCMFASTAKRYLLFDFSGKEYHTEPFVHHTFATAGSDGAFNFWDKDSKQRLKAMLRCSQPIPCSSFNNDGSIFAYSVCYDWSKGAKIIIHQQQNPIFTYICHRRQRSKASHGLERPAESEAFYPFRLEFELNADEIVLDIDYKDHYH
ncbi:hypothetical protein DH2020_030859 [Rehmannia glutinosa]|uniref:Rae1-like protein n=1 Tax=Rehmannia glutinosa TaxID=99300 RepID=A0ABR0VM26_REHGL